MSDAAPKYTGHDFAELLTTELTHATAITAALRSRGIDARTVEAGGWTIGGPSTTGTVLVPRPSLEAAQAEVSVLEGAASQAKVDPESASLVCPTCGYSLAGLDLPGVCPACGVAVAMSATSAPVASDQLGVKRDRMRPVALGLLIVIVALIMLAVVQRGSWMAGLRGAMPW